MKDGVLGRVLVPCTSVVAAFEMWFGLWDPSPEFHSGTNWPKVRPAKAHGQVRQGVHGRRIFIVLSVWSHAFDLLPCVPPAKLSSLHTNNTNIIIQNN